MNPAAAGGVPYRVPPEPSRWPAIVMALLVHAGLLLFLIVGISWQNNAPVEVEAEVWDTSTQLAAPPPPPPPAEVQPQPEPQPQVQQPPAPKPPDIALEREKQRKEEQKQKELEKETADKLAKAKAAAEKKLLEKIRQDELRRIAQAAGGTAGTAPKSTGPKTDPGYIASLTAKIKANIIYAGSRDVPGNPSAVYRIDQLPTGEIIRFKKIKSSGIPEYDHAVEQAITASSPLPKKKDGTVERTIEPVFKLKDSP